MLVDAAWEDVATMMLQEQEQTLFLQGLHKSLGRGPSVAQLAVKEKTAQRKRSKDYQESFKAGVFSISEDAGQRYFIPSKGARHRTPAANTIQGSYEPPLPPPPPHSVENYENSQNSVICLNGPNTQNSQSQNQNFGFVQASSVFGHTSQQNHPWGLTVNSQKGSNRGLTAEQMNTLNNNPPLLCFLNGTMARCQGCRTKFTENMREPPNDLLVKMLVVKPRLINGNWVPGWQKSWGYFHLNINCLQRHLSFVEVEDIYMWQML